MVQALEQTPAPVQRTQTPTAAPAAQPAAASAASDETPGSQTDAPDTMQAQQTQQVAKQNAAQAQPHPSILQICYTLALAFLLAQNLALSARLRKDRVRLDVPGCPVPVYRTEVLRSACLFGLFRPAIYLPPQALGEDGAPNRYVLLHELTHYIESTKNYAAYEKAALEAAYRGDTEAMDRDAAEIRKTYEDAGLPLAHGAGRAARRWYMTCWARSSPSRFGSTTS